MCLVLHACHGYRVVCPIWKLCYQHIQTLWYRLYLQRKWKRLVSKLNHQCSQWTTVLKHTSWQMGKRTEFSFSLIDIKTFYPYHRLLFKPLGKDLYLMTETLPSFSFMKDNLHCSLLSCAEETICAGFILWSSGLGHCCPVSEFQHFGEKLLPSCRTWGSHSSAYEGFCLWDTTLFSPLKVDWCFKGTCCLHLQGQWVSKTGNQHEAGSKQNLAYSFTLRMETVWSPETSVYFLKTAQRNVPEDRTLHVAFIFRMQYFPP
jgi:hypothetical protein